MNLSVIVRIYLESKKWIKASSKVKKVDKQVFHFNKALGPQRIDSFH